MLIVDTLLSLLFLAVLGTPSACQEGDLPPAVAQDEVSIQARKEAYLDLLSKYNNAVAAYTFEVRSLRLKGVPREEWPEPPAREYLVRFESLAEAGNGEAMLWVVKTLTGLVDDEQERVRLAKRYFTALARDHATEELIQEVIDEVVPARKLLGVEYVTAVLHTIAQNCQSPETEARALLGEARVLLNYGKPRNEEDRQKGMDLMQILVDGYSGTKAALEAAEPLYRRAVRETLETQQEWARQALQLERDGVGPEGWPPYPLDAFHAQFQTLASAGHLLSGRWLEGFYPGFAKTQGLGIDKTLLFVCDWIRQSEHPKSIYWQGLRFDLLTLLVETFPDQPWLHKLVVEMGNAVTDYTPEQYVPVLRRVIELVPNERTRYEAELVLAQSLERGSTFEMLSEALRTYQCVVDESPVERQRKEAEVAMRTFALTMPGAPMPPFVVPDNEGFTVESTAYAGKVLLLFFWSYNEEASMKDVPWINELDLKYQGDEYLRILGMNVDPTTKQLFARFARQAGVTWRNALLQHATTIAGTQFRVSSLPTLFVIDAEGIIRGRALDHEQTEALIEQLLAEAAAKGEDGEK